MKYSKLILALPFCLALSVQAAGEANAADPAKPLAIVNGTVIPAEFGDLLRQQREAGGQSDETYDDDRIRDALVASELLAQEAVKKGLHKLPRVALIDEYQRKELLARAALEEYVGDNPLSDEMLKAEYERVKARTGDTEYRVRHILVPSEKEAKDIVAKLNRKKAKFEDLAKKQSKDASAGNGGDLGWIGPGGLVPEFAEAMGKLKKGQYTKSPVQTQYGWHVIQVDDTRSTKIPEFDEVRMRIAQQLQKVQIRQYLRELRATAKVE